MENWVWIRDSEREFVWVSPVLRARPPPIVVTVFKFLAGAVITPLTALLFVVF